jgi:hypothetical protein
MLEKAELEVNRKIYGISKLRDQISLFHRPSAT